jgi:two-component system, response regulator / RNA-binding antiterminator
MKRRPIRIPEPGRRAGRDPAPSAPHRAGADPAVDGHRPERHAGWPELGPEALAADFVFFDADMGHDGMFPWDPGQPPMPMIALIGSEAPGRIEWSLKAGAHAQLLKPVGDNGAYSALLIARDAFDAQKGAVGRDRRPAAAAGRTADRGAGAVTLLAARGKSEAEAYAQLRQMAMAWRISFEDAAARIVAQLIGGAG